ncbi:Trichothecene C-3 esterase [Pseudocercospora fuligena]|uniref:Trichothecene C-3 esterase n=1 Tax=Pseudocercospora fuligena TaxID=685502 RepID=A0A8H6VN87_9PEZI|nr:Trichothecene C-3 esterase [Pseudocercospora fuligena]
MKRFAYFILGGVAATAATLPATTPIAPSKDPWYTAPENFQMSPPGEVLRIRPAPSLSNLKSTFGNISSAYNILFRTTDSHYKPSWAVTTLLLPTHTKNSSNLLSYQIPYNTPYLDASPSYAIYNSSFTTGLITSDISTALSKGWSVNIPDHEGPLAAFTAGITEGHATIDSIRAALTTLPSDSKVALWGYSGGSIASQFALELSIQYAPELQNIIVGAALGGIVPNITAALPNLVQGSYFAGLIPDALVGISREYPEAYTYLLSQLKPETKAKFLSVENSSVLDIFPEFANETIWEYFKSGSDFFSAPGAEVISEAWNRDGVQGFHGIPTVPMYIYKAVHDEISLVGDADALVVRECQLGANILHERNMIGGHLAEETNGDQRALEWLSGVFDGTLKHEDCTIRDVSVNVTDSAL